jgi:predicted transcriptional regulator
MAAEPDPKSIFDMEPDEAHEARLDAEAMADYAAGRIVPHAEVVKWLESWGKPNELPCPEPKPH